MLQNITANYATYDDVIKWKHFPRYLTFVRGIHRSPVNSPHKDQWHGVLMFSLIWAWLNGWVNNREAGDLRRHRAHYDVTLMHLPRHKIHQLIFYCRITRYCCRYTDQDSQLLSMLYSLLDGYFTYKNTNLPNSDRRIRKENCEISSDR